MPNYKEIIIHWGPRVKYSSESFIESNDRNVVYQIYCDSHIYGSDVLAYIGKTDRTMEERFQEHMKSNFQHAQNLQYSVGVIDMSNLDSLELEIPESILIANHKPFYNKEFIHDLPIKAKQEKIIIINNGEHGMLKSSCTNYWWVMTTI